ncbi:MAG: hypothetical protein ACK4TI_01165 [Nitrososphaerales archaeon]
MPPGKYRVCTLMVEKELEEWIREKYKETAEEALKRGEKIPTIGPYIEAILHKIMTLERRGELKISIQPNEVKMTRRS